jgi:FlgD Ig-like domain
VESSRLVRVVFAVLVLGTVGAFVLTQVLKTEMPVVLRFAVRPLAISPNGDGVRDRVRLGFDLSESAEVSFSVIDRDGNDVREIFDDRQLAGDRKHRFWWDGRDDDGHVAPDGIYRMRVVRRKEGRRLDSFKEVRVDTRRPDVELASAAPGVVDPSSARRVAVEIRYRGPRTPHPELRVWRTDDGPPRIVDRFRGDGERSGTWNGRTISGDYAVDGDYAFQVRVRDHAGNEALGPPGVPSPHTARPHTGVAVRRLTLEGPGGVVPAGAVARLRVGPTPRRFSFELARLGSRKVLKRGARRGGRLRVRMPDEARTGVYVVRVRASRRSGGRRSRGAADRVAAQVASWPLVVAGLPPRGIPLDRRRPLVVLPAISWQGDNRWDSDLDGFADTLRDGEAVPAERPYAGGRLPPGLTVVSAPLLRFLDRAPLAYDLTTDLALARGEGPALGNAPGIAIGGTAIWLPRRLRDRLRAEVERAGKTLTAFGGAGLRRSVALVGDELRFPSPQRPDNLFGERTRLERVDPPAPLVAFRDRLGLFAGVDDLFGEFSLVEPWIGPPAGFPLLTAAGRFEERPAFVAYRFGKGIVIRPGTPQWTRQLDERALDVEVPRITRRIWRQLARP